MDLVTVGQFLRGLLQQNLTRSTTCNALEGKLDLTTETTNFF